MTVPKAANGHGDESSPSAEMAFRIQYARISGDTGSFSRSMSASLPTGWRGDWNFAVDSVGKKREAKRQSSTMRRVDIAGLC